MTFSLGRRAFVAAFAALGFSATGLAAQDGYEPGRLEIIVPFNPGGSADRLARSIGQFLPEELGVPVTVTNRPGGSGNTRRCAPVAAAPLHIAGSVTTPSSPKPTAKSSAGIAYTPDSEYEPDG